MNTKPGSVTLAQFRQQQLLATVKPVWVLAKCLHLAALLRSIANGFASTRETAMKETALEMAFIAACFLLPALPTAVVHSGRLALLSPACVVVHFVRTSVFFASGLGWAPNIAAAATCLKLRVELVLELAMCFQDQMSLPVMAILHALRQAAWMSYLVCRMHGDPYQVLLRGVLNWLFMMGLSCVFEWRTRSSYRKLCSTQQQQHQQQQEQQPSLPRPVPSLPSIEGASEFTSHLPEPAKPTSEEDECSFPVSGSTMTESTSQSSTPEALRTSHDSTGCSAQSPTPGAAAKQRVASSSRLPPQQVVQAATALIQQQLPASSIMQVIQQQRRLPSAYTRSSTRPRQTVHVKIKGVELADLPPDMSSIMEQQLKHIMPGVVMSGLAFRNGCVMMTVDLMDLMAQPTLALASSMMDLVTRVMRDNTMGQLLNTGATMCIQTPDEVVLCQWDADSSSYALAATPAGQLGPDHSCCRLVSATPAVNTLPDSPSAPVAGPMAGPHLSQAAQGKAAAAATGCHPLTFTVELQLPSGCRLDGWQPAADALPLSPDGSAMLLARRMGGGYLPVTVERVSCVVGPGGDEAGMRHTAQVLVDMDGKAPALLCLELWHKQQPTQMAATGSELLVSHMPLLVLPSSWQAAAVQLQQHMDHMGGVQPRQAHPAAAAGAADPASDAACCLLEDLGMWLSNHHSPATAAVHDGLTNDLLTHVVLHGLGDVAELMVTALGRRTASTATAALSPRTDRLPSSGATTSAGASAWLWQAAHGNPHGTAQATPVAMPAADGGDGSGGGGGCMPLLHAAMTSGQPTMLEQVFRWGALYGGPSWAWPWELEYGEQGCTALHLAAAQPTCPALLETITRTLPPGQVQAARSVWLHGRGGLGTSPAEVFALASQGGSVGKAWAQGDQPTAGDSSSSREPEINGCSAVSIGDETAPHGYRTASSSTAASTDVVFAEAHTCCGAGDVCGPTTAAAPHSSTLATPPPAPPSVITPQSWLGSVIEVWTTRETDEYRAWARRQMSSMVSSAALLMALGGLIGSFQSFKAGCGLHEAPDIWLHVIPYVIMAAAIRGATWLGDWQAWMLPTHAFHCLGYLAKTYVPVGRAFLWASSASSPITVIYVVLVLTLDQTPLPLLLVAQLVKAYCHSLAYATVGVPHPLLQALAVHSCALAVSTLCRVWQLRAFHRWQATQQTNKQSKLKTA